ncbi:hypothetical protein ABPG72_018493 [Tetrahymena utriculariae]
MYQLLNLILSLSDFKVKAINFVFIDRYFSDLNHHEIQLLFRLASADQFYQCNIQSQFLSSRRITMNDTKIKNIIKCLNFINMLFQLYLLSQNIYCDFRDQISLQFKVEFQINIGESVYFYNQFDFFVSFFIFNNNLVLKMYC